MEKSKKNNKEEKYNVYGQIFWLTGLPCSGKTTIANELAKRIDAEILDGDDVRELTNNQDFSPEARERHMWTVAKLANRFSKYTNVIVSLVSPIKRVRDEIKKTYPHVREIFIYCSPEECERRDVKGMYKLAREGKIKNFTGVDAPYEEPDTSRYAGKENKVTFVDTEFLTVEECVDIILTREYDHKKYALFIGRFQPPHEGHFKLIQTVLDEGQDALVALRLTGRDESNPYSVDVRRELFFKQFGNRVKVITIPDISEVCYGRKVGYNIRNITLDKETESISATKLRQRDKNNETKKE